MENRPLGIFDSGVGGLTVAREIYQEFPHLNTIYVGDTARVPYGNRSKTTVIRFSREIVEFLMTKKVKAIVVACSTASAQAIDELKAHYDIPIYGVIAPAAKYAANITKTNRVGVIGTRGTIASKQFNHEVLKENNAVSILSKACPLFVPLVEEGIVSGKIAKEVARLYLASFTKDQIDTLIMGCTHYPMLETVIQQTMGEQITIINPGKALVEELKRNPLFSSPQSNKKAIHSWYVTDNPDLFSTIASHILQTEKLIKPKVIRLKEISS
jgi:glutamate racemase